MGWALGGGRLLRPSNVSDGAPRGGARRGRSAGIQQGRDVGWCGWCTKRDGIRWGAGAMVGGVGALSVLLMYLRGAPRVGRAGGAMDTAGA